MLGSVAVAAGHSFTRRHNVRHKLWGHLFGGRYKAVLVEHEDSLYLPTLIDYVHLNPVRAGLVPVEAGLETFPWSSLSACYAVPISKRRPWLEASRGLRMRGLIDDAEGRRHYVEYLEKRVREEGMESGRSLPDGQSLQSTLRRGWVFGLRAFKERMMKLGESVLGESAQRSNVRPAPAVQDHSLVRALAMVAVGVKVCGLTPELLPSLPFGDERKVIIALAVKRETTVSLTWIAEQLHMGTRSTVSRATTTLAKELNAKPELSRLYESIATEVEGDLSH
jgi:putative transposase